jgi:hypothetical protein
MTCIFYALNLGIY